MAQRECNPIEQVAAAVIRRVIAEQGHRSAQQLRRALRTAYPFGSQRGTAYLSLVQVWRGEVERCELARGARADRNRS